MGCITLLPAGLGSFSVDKALFCKGLSLICVGQTVDFWRNIIIH